MILADTSVWLDHMRQPDVSLEKSISEKRVLVHPFVIGEIAMGALRRRDRVLGALQRMPQAVIAYDEEVLSFVEKHRLWGSGIGYVDAHLLVSARLTGHCTLWTRDKRLRAAAQALNLAWPEPKPS